jgi:exosortase
MSQFQPPRDARRSTQSMAGAARPTTPTRGTARAAVLESPMEGGQVAPLTILGLLVLLLVAAYWDMFALTSAAWSDELYSHGWIVPVIALALLWMRWEPLGPVPAVERWVGVPLLAVGLIMRLVAAYLGMVPLDRLSLLPSIFGVFMLVGGFRIIRWAWPALAFLVFMFPLPNRIEELVLIRLQRLASICSTFVLQTLGVAAFRNGNLISIPGLDQPLNIADACSGLRMATIFGAFAVATVFMIERPWWDKLVILLSAIPIALVVNVFRITMTAMLYMWVGKDNHIVQKLGHDWAGYFMMPMALALLWLELQILERLTIPIDTVQIRPVTAARGATVPLR